MIYLKALTILFLISPIYNGHRQEDIPGNQEDLKEMNEKSKSMDQLHRAKRQMDYLSNIEDEKDETNTDKRIRRSTLTCIDGKCSGVKVHRINNMWLFVISVISVIKYVL